MITRVVALGRRTAGDDAVGPAILDHLRTLAPPGVELVELAEASGLIPLIGMPLVIVDAVVMDGGSPGDVVELDAADLPPRTRALSTHGIDLPQAIALGRALAPPGAHTSALPLVGVVIDPPDGSATALSPGVAGAIPGAVRAVLARLAR